MYYGISQGYYRKEMYIIKNFKHLALVLLLPVALLLSVGAQAATAPGALLPRERVYGGQFTDVDPASWYYDYVVSGYEYGLFNGRGDGFDPDADITVGELLALSARIHAAYVGDTIPAAEGNIPWFFPHAVYLEEKGIIEDSVVGWVHPAEQPLTVHPETLTAIGRLFGYVGDVIAGGVGSRDERVVRGAVALRGQGQGKDGGKLGARRGF